MLKDQIRQREPSAGETKEAATKRVSADAIEAAGEGPKKAKTVFPSMS
jgi:hypothetical protein